jgi:protein-disulfide isomerase
MAGIFGAVAQVQQEQVAAATVTPAAAAVSGTVDVAKALEVNADDRVEGKATAPVTIIEYASMTCPHCRDFNNETLPKVEEEWVQTGKARYVLRHLPWDDLAAAEAAVMRCADPAQYYPLAKAYFGAQEAIMKASSPLDEVKQIARFAGLDDASVQSCITDPANHKFITDMRNTAQTTLGVKGTPTFFINGERVDGEQSYDQMRPYLQKAYKKATARK